MNRKERMLAAMRRKPMDRVPFSTIDLHPYAGSRHAEDPSYAPLLEKIGQSSGVFAKISVMRPMHEFGRPRPGLLDRRIEGVGDARVRRTILHTPKGDLVETTSMPEDKPPQVIRPFITSDAEIESYLSLPYDPPEIDITRAREFYASAGDRGVMGIPFADPLFAIAGLFESGDFRVRCMTDLPSILRMEDFAFERCREELRRIVAACRGLDCVLHTGGPELCTPPMMSPSLFGRLVTPYLRKLAEIIHDGGLLCGIHCHGHVREIFSEILETGADLLEPIEPPDQGNIALAALMQQAEGRIGLTGGVQDLDFYSARPGEMTRKVEEIARVVNGRTGFIMSPTGTPFERPCPEVFARNFMEWLDAADRVLIG
jgi:uroporphyrinogen decarboxylase